MNAKEHERGFTLVEMIVSVALFAVVMLVATGALLALVGANRKAQALQSVMENLNMALDGMVRSIRMGSDYHCGSGSYSVPKDCTDGEIFADGSTLLAMEAFGGDSEDVADQWIYMYDATTKRIYKSETGNPGARFAITAPSVTIDSMNFYVIGTTRGDTVQPKVVIEIKGTAGGVDTKAETTFAIQATAVQRVLDL